MTSEASATAPECLILSDEELALAGAAEQPRFRNWRMDSNQLAATRIFGGGGAPPPEKNEAGLRQFPSAFQTYKPGSGGAKKGGGFGGGKKFPFFEHKPKTEKPPLAPAAPAAEAPAPAIQIQLPPTPPEDEETMYRYSQCTPPCYSPKTPPYWPEENPAPKQDEQPASIGTA
jgi:hypothetical protein